MTLRESSAEDLIRQVRNGEIDVAIVGTPSPPAHGLPSRTILETRMIAVVSISHELASIGMITLPGLLEHDLMCTPKGSGIRAALDVARNAERLGLTIRYESGNPDMLVQFASLGLGIAIVPDGTSIRHRDDVKVIEIVEPEVRGRLELIWTGQSATSPAVRELIRLSEVLS